jgi:UDP-N-acetyl-D-mannosaminuronic acid dehydrogenase
VSPRLESLVVLVKPDDTIAATVRRMATDPVAFFGLAVVLDDGGSVLGIVNNGDILRLLAAEFDLSRPVKSVMIKDPIAVRPHLPPDEIMADVYRQIRGTRRLTREGVAHVLITDDRNRLTGVINFADLVARHGRRGERVAIYGMGFVGLTLAATLANRGYNVVGVDVDAEQVARLGRCDMPVHEPGLEDMVRASLELGVLTFATSPDGVHQGVSIIAVGTPVDASGTADLAALEAVTRTVAARLKRGDLVMLRSTVPVGTTRGFVTPLLEQLSGLMPGEDFNLAFTPERTIEGRALRELRELPQIIGGLTATCAQRAAAFWSTTTRSVVHVDSLEAAELVKLANNSFRDLSFAFSNGLAMLSDRYNVDAFRLIHAANEGYPRNTIPLPSPGVGGYCLTKDPFLYAAVAPDMVHAELARTGRDANRRAASYPLEALRRYAARSNRPLAGMRVLVLGLAFKGLPETNDLRGSTAVDVVHALKAEGVLVAGWDAIVPADAIRGLGIEHIEPLDGAARVDAILIMNNHTYNTPPGLLAQARRPMLVFDGWSLLDAREVEQHKGMTYATMGYMTPAT